MKLHLYQTNEEKSRYFYLFTLESDYSFRIEIACEKRDERCVTGSLLPMHVGCYEIKSTISRSQCKKRFVGGFCYSERGWGRVGWGWTKKIWHRRRETQIFVAIIRKTRYANVQLQLSFYPPPVISLIAIRQNLFTSGRISRIATPTLTKKPRTLKWEDTKGEEKGPSHSSIGLLFVYSTSLFRRGRPPSKNSSMIFERSFRTVSFSYLLLLLLSWLDTFLKRWWNFFLFFG